MLPVLVSTTMCERSGESSPSCSSLARPSVIRSVLNPEIPLSEGRVSRRLDPVRPNYQDQDLLDVLGHCFTDPLFQSFLRFPDGTEMSEDQVRTNITKIFQYCKALNQWEYWIYLVQVDDVLSTGGGELELQLKPPGTSKVKMGFAGLERERESAGHWSVLAGPEICLTTEEKSRLADLFDRQVAACRYCIPVRYVGKVEAGEGRGRGTNSR